MISSINPVKPAEPKEKKQQKQNVTVEERNKKVLPRKELEKSNLAEGFRELRKESKNQSLIQASKRSTSFAAPAESRAIEEQPELRGSDLTIKLQIRRGPIDFKPSSTDPTFTDHEPNSETRLKRRTLAHHTLQDYLADRYVVRINELYAIIRKVEGNGFQSGNDWNVPLIGDWVLFGVIGQKSDFKNTTPYIASQVNRLTTQPQSHTPSKSKKLVDKDNDQEVVDELNEELARDDQAKQPKEEEVKKPQPKKFVTFKLIDMSSNKISSSGSGVIKMILFESDSQSSSSGGGGEGEKSYRGGSGGAYEKYWKEQPGTLIGILNPKVLKNRPSSYSRGPTTSPIEMLTITPENHQSIIVIGRSKDLGSCVAKRIDTGTLCNDWCDLRNSTINGNSHEAICDFHLQRQIKKVRANRAEFFSGTSGMVQHTGKKFGHSSKDTKNGLLPATHGLPKRTSINGQITYICPGKSSSTNIHDMRKKKKFEDRYSVPTDNEKVQGIKLKRKRELDEIQINKILNDGDRNDSYGFNCIKDARNLLHNNKKQNHLGGGSHKEGKKQEVDNVTVDQSNHNSSSSKSVYSTQAIRAIGFNPTHTNKSNSNQDVLLSNHHSSKAYTDLLDSSNKQHGGEEVQEELSIGPKQKKLNSLGNDRRRRGVDGCLDRQLGQAVHDLEEEEGSGLGPGTIDDDDDDDLIICG
ncbi:hypothetical protein Pst134EB_027452 [Puccinia striiformis f. sp. tritici]|nr:hypothetical protein Pst134EB_027452 [Puccinia striiformis f. sp. tritici]